MENCKRCLLHESADKNTLDDIKVRLAKISDGERADGELYEIRLEQCKQCDNLISGVCMKCGCYVEFRAAFKKQKCPDTKNKKW